MLRRIAAVISSSVPVSPTLPIWVDNSLAFNPRFFISAAAAGPGATIARIMVARFMAARRVVMPCIVIVDIAPPICAKDMCADAAIGRTLPSDLAKSSKCILPEATVAII